MLKTFLAAIVSVCMIHKPKKHEGLVKDLHLSLNPLCLAVTFPSALRLASCVIIITQLFIRNSHTVFWVKQTNFPHFKYGNNDPSHTINFD